MPQRKHEPKRKVEGASSYGEYRFEMRLDLKDERERELSEILKAQKGKREASMNVKQMLYERHTGKDWFTGQPLQSLSFPGVAFAAPAQAMQEAKPTSPKRPVIFNQADLDALDEDLSNFGQRK